MKLLDIIALKTYRSNVGGEEHKLLSKRLKPDIDRPESQPNEQSVILALNIQLNIRVATIHALQDN